MLRPELKAALDAHREDKWLRFFVVWGVLRIGALIAGMILAAKFVFSFAFGEPVIAQVVDRLPFAIGVGAATGVLVAYCAREAVLRSDHGRSSR